MKEKIDRSEKCAKACGSKVKALHRTKIGKINVKDLKLGQWRYLTSKEVEELQK